MSTFRTLFVLAVLALPGAVLAQSSDPGPQPYRKWDVGGGLGLRFGDTDDPVVPLGSWNAEVSRYWTAHVTTSFSLMTAGDKSYSAPYVPYRTQYSTPGLAAYSATVGYQFFDNIFLHPYVVGGARFGSYSTTTTVYSPSFSKIVSSVTSPSVLEARPVIGGGFKSYFANGRAFMRSELLMAVNPHGSPHTVLTIGAGVDF